MLFLATTGIFTSNLIKEQKMQVLILQEQLKTLVKAIPKSKAQVLTELKFQVQLPTQTDY